MSSLKDFFGKPDEATRELTAARLAKDSALSAWQADPTDVRWRLVQSSRERCEQLEMIVKIAAEQAAKARRDAAEARYAELVESGNNDKMLASLEGETTAFVAIVEAIAKLKTRVDERFRVALFAAREAEALAAELGKPAPPDPLGSSGYRMHVNRAACARLRELDMAYARVDEFVALSWSQT